MHQCRKLLYVSHGTTNNTEGLKQALSLARNNDAPLAILMLCPEFPKELPDYQKTYEEVMCKQMRESVEAIREALKLSHDAIAVTIEMMNDNTPAIKIIQHVLRHGHDMVIKEGVSRDAQGGFKAVDMELLRKCPVPVWLCKPIAHSHQDIQVAVAIDPEGADSVSRDLSMRLLERARALADGCSGVVHIVSCWDYEIEMYLRNNSWIPTSDADVDQAILRAQTEHRAALEDIIKASGVDSGLYQTHHIRGHAAECIPEFVRTHPIDILVMGTVARSGIPGFLIGNTAEDIVQKLTCSLVALKPNGFVSPISVH